MINYIISSNQKSIVSKIRSTILNHKMKYDIEERTYDLSELNLKAKNINNEINGFKVYLFDIKNLDEIKLIESVRMECKDWNSIIIVIATDTYIKNEIIKKNLYILDYIDKHDNIEEKLNDDFYKIKLYYDNREKCLSYEFNRVIKRIEYKNIIAIEKEKDSKKCIIKTTYGTYTIGGSLKDVYKKLDCRFIKLSRSTIANIDQIEEYNEIENVILFKNRSTTSDISRSNKKKLIDACHD